MPSLQRRMTTPAHGSHAAIGRGSWAWRLPAIGVGQIIAWGTLYYALAVMGPLIAADLQCALPALYGAFTLSLVASGVIAPTVGRLIDHGHGRRVLCASALLGALGFCWLGSANGLVALYGSWLVLGIAMGAGLYDAAFAVLHRGVDAADYRRAVTVLTLIAGFASTVFWPVTRWWCEAWGWRATVFAFAGLHVLVGCPLYALAVPARPSAPAAAALDQAAAPPTMDHALRRRFHWLAGAFALATFAFSGLSVHLITLLTLGGLSLASAVFVGTLIGPLQVFARIVEYLCARRARSTTVGSTAFALLVFALAALWLADTVRPGAAAWAIAFGMLYGCSNGVMTIIRGTVPAELFARIAAQGGFGALLGRLALPSFVAKASAPFAFSFLLGPALPRDFAVALLVMIAAGAWFCYERARRG